MTRWFEEWPNILKMEIALMKKEFPDLELRELNDGRIAWYGKIETKENQLYYIMIIYPNDFPKNPPKAYPISLMESGKLKGSPHTYPDGSLCISYPHFGSPTISAYHVLMGAIYWIHGFELFIDTGKWFGVENNPTSRLYSGDSKLSTKFKSSKEKDMIFQIYNTYISGDVKNLAAGSKEFIQSETMEMLSGKFDTLSEYLSQIGIEKVDIAELKEALIKDNSNKDVPNIGQRTGKWIGKMISSASKGALKVGASVASEILTKSITKYLGI